MYRISVDVVQPSAQAFLKRDMRIPKLKLHFPAWRCVSAVEFGRGCSAQVLDQLSKIFWLLCYSDKMIVIGEDGPSLRDNVVVLR